MLVRRAGIEPARPLREKGFLEPERRSDEGSDSRELDESGKWPEGYRPRRGSYRGGRRIKIPLQKVVPESAQDTEITRM